MAEQKTIREITDVDLLDLARRAVALPSTWNTAPDVKAAAGFKLAPLKDDRCPLTSKRMLAVGRTAHVELTGSSPERISTVGLPPSLAIAASTRAETAFKSGALSAV
ncbi:hypothetical protein [Chelativorans sp. J32]|uniref:hypothetical protein n=1 Tax=Chelativorans sp. J32 TaxID=935840 RepID=UPI0012EC6C78|nr:hypothetical protein [Chelativorans sp. J32]